MKRSVTLQEMESLGRALVAARDDAQLTSQEADFLHARFLAYDADGNPWSVDLRSFQWNKRFGGRWTPGIPPAQLQVDLDLLLALRHLQSAGALPPPALPPQPATPAFLPPTPAVFDTLPLTASAPVSRSISISRETPLPDPALYTAAPKAERRCPKCGTIVTANHKFCTRDGTLVP